MLSTATREGMKEQVVDNLPKRIKQVKFGIMYVNSALLQSFMWTRVGTDKLMKALHIGLRTMSSSKVSLRSPRVSFSNSTAGENQSLMARWIQEWYV